jgi:hypothetical protein
MTQPLTTIGNAFDDPMLLGRHFQGESWDSWKALLRAAFAEPLSPAQRGVFEELAGGRAPPEQRAKEWWTLSGRRSGKTSIAAGIACYLGCFVDYKPHLRAGERALIPVIAVNREQAQVCHGYIKAMLGGTRLLASLIENETAEVISLRNGCDLAVMTNSFRTSRGRTMAACIFDECSFWRSEATNVPDVEVYRAIKPSMSTIRNAMLVSIGSAYRRAGLAFATFREHFGKPSSTLVVKATTKQLNSLIDQELIDAELKADPAGAASEWLSEFRSDIVTYIDRETVEAVVIPGRTELAPMQGVSYGAFCDPAGGSGQDSFTLCIAHWIRIAVWWMWFGSGGRSSVRRL